MNKYQNQKFSDPNKLKIQKLFTYMNVGLNSYLLLFSVVFDTLLEDSLLNNHLSHLSCLPFFFSLQWKIPLWYWYFFDHTNLTLVWIQKGVSLSQKSIASVFLFHEELRIKTIIKAHLMIGEGSFIPEKDSNLWNSRCSIGFPST